MKLLLRSQTKFDEMAELDSESAKLDFFSKTQNPRRLTRPIAGHYALVDGHLLAFYCFNGSFYFRSDKNTLVLPPHVRTNWLRKDNRRSFSIFDGENLIFAFDYSAPVIEPPLELDPTPCVEEEDFDFCLFAHNVLSSPERRRLLRDEMWHS